MAAQIDFPNVELTLSPEKAFYILVKAREFDAQVEETDPNAGSNPSDDNSIAILEDAPDDPTAQEFFDAVDALNEDEQLDLLALTWLGRGDFSADEWDLARKTANEMEDKHIALYLLETPLLSDFLEEALSMLGHDSLEEKLNHL